MIPFALGPRTSSTAGLLALLAAAFLVLAVFVRGGASFLSFVGFACFVSMWSARVMYLRDRWT